MGFPLGEALAFPCQHNAARRRPFPSLGRDPKKNSRFGREPIANRLISGGPLQRCEKNHLRDLKEPFTDARLITDYDRVCRTMTAEDCNRRANECAANAAIAPVESIAIEFLTLAAQWRAMAVRENALGNLGDIRLAPSA